MIETRMVRSALERIDGAFGLHEQGHASRLVLVVNVRRQADDLRAVEPVVAEALTGLAASIEAASGKADIRELHGRFLDWREETLAVLEARDAAKQAAVATSTAERRQKLSEAEALVRGAEKAVAERHSADTVRAAEAAVAERHSTDTVRAAEEAVAERHSPDTVRAAEDAVAGRHAAPAAPAPAGSEPEEGVEMSVEEIERILEETRKKL